MAPIFVSPQNKIRASSRLLHLSTAAALTFFSFHSARAYSPPPTLSADSAAATPAVARAQVREVDSLYHAELKAYPDSAFEKKEFAQLDSAYHLVDSNPYLSSKKSNVVKCDLIRRESNRTFDSTLEVLGAMFLAAVTLSVFWRLRRVVVDHVTYNIARSKPKPHEPPAAQRLPKEKNAARARRPPY